MMASDVWRLSSFAANTNSRLKSLALECQGKRRLHEETLKESYLAQLTRPTERIGRTSRQVLEHSFRTAVTAVVSMLAARLFRLRQSYWAPITTLVITQSSLGSTLPVSWQRFIGTALGQLLAVLSPRTSGETCWSWVQAFLC